MRAEVRLHRLGPTRVVAAYMYVLKFWGVVNMENSSYATVLQH